MSLSGLVAIVAGASGGIGSATVRALVQRRADVVLAAPEAEILESLAREAIAGGVRALAVPTDLTHRSQIDRLVAKTLVTFGRIDVLVNVAGVGSSPSLCESTDEELQRVLAVNLLGPARLIQSVLPAMKAQRSGAIINVGSLAGEAGIMGIYSSSKFGLRGLSDSVRREVRSYNVAVSLIEPGFVRTPMNTAMGDRLPGPEIVAEAIVAAITRPRRRMIVPGNYRFPVLLAQAFPGLVDIVFGNRHIQNRLNRDARAARNGGP